MSILWVLVVIFIALISSMFRFEVNKVWVEAQKPRVEAAWSALTGGDMSGADDLV